MWKKLQSRSNLSPFKLIAAYYFFAVVISTLLLSLPISQKVDISYSLIDTLFTAFSAVSVTGLSTVSIVDTYTVIGKIILLLVLQVGGIGIMALGTFFWLIFGKKIGLKERRLIMTEHNQINLSGLVRMLKQIILLFFLIEIIGGLILSVYFFKYYPTWQQAFFHGFFTSISATTNAGFDLTGKSMQPFHHDYFVQLILMVLVTLGAIGFPVLIEVKRYIKNRFKKKRAHFSLFTKVTSITYFLLLIGGALLFLLFEQTNFLQDKNFMESIFYALFQSTSTRSSGLTTMDVTQLTETTLLLLAGLMYIGASPSSVGGGIRTTTFALNILFLYSYARGEGSIKLFKREIHREDLLKSFVVTLFASFICFIATLILTITENHSLMAIIFEVCSAFGTSGMSLGITSDLSIFGKIILMLLMFIGRVGILSFIFMIGGNDKKDSFHYPKERIIIG